MGVVKLSTAGIVNYEKYSSLLAGNTAFSPFSFDLLETQVLTSSAASVTFSSLSTYAADYQHLQLRMVARTNRADDDDIIQMRLNGDTGSNYSSHRLGGTGSSVVSTASTSQTSIVIGRTGAANINSNIFGPSVVDLLDAFNGSKNTTVRSLTAVNRPDSPLVDLLSGAFYNTNAITSITLLPLATFVTGSRFSLYGLKAGA